MKRKNLSLILWIGICLLLGFSSLAHSYDFTLETTSDGSTAQSVFNRGSSVYLNIVANDASGVAECAFTLTYPANALTAPSIDSGGVPVNSSDISSFFNFTFEKDGTTYQTHRENVVITGDVGKLYFSGAAINKNRGGAKAVPGGAMVLFTIKFTVKTDAPVSSAYTFSLSPTTLSNTQAGYSASGEAVPVLVNAVNKNDAKWSTLTTAFPVLMQTMTTVATSFEVPAATGSRISGMVTYLGYQKGTLKVGVYNNADLAASHLVKEINVAWGRTTTRKGSIVENFMVGNFSPGQYYLSAYIDANGNSLQDADEANGRQITPVVVSGADSIGNAIALSDPLHASGEPLYYYNWKQSNAAWNNIGAMLADKDVDGYSNIQEYINQKNGLSGFSPVLADAADNYGYIRSTELVYSNSIGPQNRIKITDLTGLLPSSGRIITIMAWDAAGNEIAESQEAVSLNLHNYETITISGAELVARFPLGTPMLYGFSVDAANEVIANVKTSTDGAINIPIGFASVVTKFVTNSVGALNSIKITDMSGTLATSGAAITVKAWDAEGNPLTESGSAVPLKLYSHGTTPITGSDLMARFTPATPMSYEFTVDSPQVVIANVKRSVDDSINIPYGYTYGTSTSSFVANSVGPRNTIYITDMSGALSTAGASITVKAWDAAGNDLTASGIAASLKLYSHGTTPIAGSDLMASFVSAIPMSYEFTVNSSKFIITNIKSNADRSINIPFLFMSGATSYMTNYISSSNIIKISDLSGTLSASGAVITIRAWDADGNSIAESGTALKVNNYATKTISGSELIARFPGRTPVSYDFTIGSEKYIITNITSNTAGTIKIPTIYTSGVVGGI